MSDSGDVLGLRGVLPGPGWHVLDAARTHRFTGELVMHGDTDVRVYLDRGLIYTAERSTDPSLGARLVDAGAISQAQLDYGTLRVGDIEHLGRLFERVPSINRDSVLVVNQLMTDECVRSVAGEHIVAVDVTPYRHHPSGMHRWEVIREVEASLASDVPEMALPAPAPDARPVSAPPPAAYLNGEPATSPASSGQDTASDDRDHDRDDDRSAEEPPYDLERRVVTRDVDDEHHRAGDQGDDGRPADALFDDLVRWDEPSRIDPGTTMTPRRTERATALADPITDDWIDRLADHGIEDAPVGAPVGRLTSVAVRVQEHFEMVWPSGETIDVVPDPADAPPVDDTADADVDRAGPTARIGATPTVDEPAPTLDEPASSELAIRRAVATIDTGSLEARRRLVDAANPTSSTPIPDLPGRLAMRSEHIARTTTAPTSPTSVFDEVPLEVPPNEPEPQPTTTRDRHGRAGALRRLIGHLRGD